VHLHKIMDRQAGCRRKALSSRIVVRAAGFMIEHSVLDNPAGE
jgi:hypothetical protein